MLLGQLAVPASFAAALQPPDVFRALVVVVPVAQRVPKLSVYADTLAATGPVRVRAGLYDDATLALRGGGDEVILQAGVGPAWIDLPFVGATPGGVVVPPSTMRVGFLPGDVGLSVYADPASAVSGSYTAADTYSDGLASVLGTSTAARVFAAYAETFTSWSPPDELETWYARLPWELSQEVFSATSPVAASSTQAEVAWHGTGLDPERGAFAIAKRGGKFDALVGERVRVSVPSPQKTIYVYVNDVSDDLDQDLSVPRRAFSELAELCVDWVEATVTRMS